jgi:hypothetical protein
MSVDAALPRRAAGVRVEHRHNDNVLTTSDGSAHVLNDTALALWELCDGGTAPHEMVHALHQFYDADREEIDAAVRRILDDLAELGLVDWVHT